MNDDADSIILLLLGTMCGAASAYDGRTTTWMSVQTSQFGRARVLKYDIITCLENLQCNIQRSSRILRVGACHGCPVVHVHATMHTGVFKHRRNASRVMLNTQTDLTSTCLSQTLRPNLERSRAATRCDMHSSDTASVLALVDR